MTTQIMYLVLSFVLTAILGKIIIPILKKLKVGQNTRKEGPRAHLKKQGTPTMGGIMMIISIIIFVSLYCILTQEKSDIMPIIAVALTSLGFGIVGFVDDYKKVVLKNTEGLNPKLKMFGLSIISVIYTVFLIKYAQIGTDIIIPILNYNLVLPIWLYIPFIIFVMLGSTNAVNLTDGVDGLAGSVSAIMVTAISIIAMKMGMVSISVFGVISSMMIYLKQPLLLVLIAIIPVVETISVILQVLYFRKTGKRLLRMSPLHHHFELTGWRENKVVAVFSLVTLIASIGAILIV